ncbi:hypothetical protein OIE69_43910 (plasmid) [Actinacidiphila glaucinigra]|uniref:hypothetical protein n=1 Tax=Actinacidiphila glaucinigra TaxID=235986 RepID=UPI002DD9B6D8|nr:hypothetical protein [Actinacidiphila glaucinigra]WSD65851.1 hypothetical protein OIE69_43910 [Actinacidiphila glaucinigra]
MAPPHSEAHERKTDAPEQADSAVGPLRRQAVIDPAPVIDAGRLARLPRGLGDQLRRTRNL